MARPLILVIDDDAAILSLLEEILTEEGFHTMLLWEGRSAYDQVREVNPALIILDLKLETSDAGEQILSQLSADPRLCQTPVIICSADRRLLEDGVPFVHPCVALLRKPFAIDELLQEVQLALAGRARGA